MNDRNFFPMDATAGGGAAAPAGADPAAGAAGADPGTAASAAAAGAGGNDGAAPAGGAQPGSLLARGAAAAAAGSGDSAPAAGAADAPPTVPEKYLVKNEDGSVNHEATALKLAGGYSHLERRLGTGDAPPKDPAEYAPELPAGVSMDALKADPLYTGFLKGAHAKGMTNGQVSYVLNEWATRQALANSPEVGAAELRKAWPDDATMQKGLTDAHRATHAFGGDLVAKLDKKFGNDPDFLQLMAKIGRELNEDTPAAEALNANEVLTLESIYKHPGYLDGKHPEHTKLVAQAKAINLKRTGGA